MTEAQYINLPISRLRPGMFVVAIARQVGGHAAVNNPGIVPNDDQIANMKRHGIEFVRVDPARSEVPVDPEAVPAAEEPAVTAIPETNAVDAAAQEQRRLRAAGNAEERIKRLYDEARDLQQKFMQQVRDGEALDSEPLAEVADEMVETMFSHGDAMLCLARIRSKDAYLMEHSMNVAILLANFGRYLGFDKPLIKELTLGGLLHDVGKVMTPDAVLHKPGKLTDDEFRIMREHATHSRMILRATAGITDAMIDVASNHHEKLDGSGYPRGLKAEELSLYSRMASVVDVYDALTADRVYKEGMPCTKAFRILMEGADSHFDGELVQKFIKCIGVYSPGSLVQLSNGRLALVIERNSAAPLRPRVKVIYNAKTRQYTEVKMVDLARAGMDIKIEGSVDHKQYGIELERFL